MIVSLVACIALGYLCGALPFGLWIGKVFRGVDVRTLGSGNIGATNVHRAFGPRLGLPALVLDIAKGAVPVAWVPRLAIAQDFPGGAELCALAVGAAAVAGHVWTVFAGFRGGKGVATMAGVLFALAPLAFAAFAVVWTLTVLVTRYVSLGSILGAIAFTVALALEARTGIGSPRFAFGAAAALLVIWRHRSNLQRLVRGEERRISWRGGTTP